MKSVKSKFAAAAIALAAAVPAYAAVGDVYTSAPFNGVTFTFTELSTTSLSFNLAGSLAGNWATATSLGAFDLKDVGVDFGAAGVTATATNGGSVTVGQNTQLNASADCDAAGSPPGSICFDISPDFSVTSPFNTTFIISLTGATFNIADTGPHLQIAWTDPATACQNGKPSCAIGSLYSLNVPQSSTSSSSSNTSITVPEPNSQALALLALGLLGVGFWTRRKA